MPSIALDSPRLPSTAIDFVELIDSIEIKEVKSAVVHYEIATIHPFSDGNGRIGRLWQTLILAQWNPLFAWIPMESVLYDQRPEYYLSLVTIIEGESSVFYHAC